MKSGWVKNRNEVEAAETDKEAKKAIINGGVDLSSQLIDFVCSNTVYADELLMIAGAFEALFEALGFIFSKIALSTINDEVEDKLPEHELACIAGAVCKKTKLIIGNYEYTVKFNEKTHCAEFVEKRAIKENVN